jgi:TRAP-type uncharacterized transport system substrate-binding protein
MSDGVGDGSARYSVCCDNGAIYLHTDDLAEAHEYAADLNEPGIHERVAERLGVAPWDPGVARVFENTRDRGMVEVESDAR